jgi:hypothetical protein
MTDATVFGPKATEQIRKTVREVARMMRNPAPQRGRYTQEQRRVQVILMEDLLAAVDTDTDPSFAKARVRAKKSNGDLEITTREITIVNRCEDISVDSGRYGKAEWIDGEWQLYVADCPAQSQSMMSMGGGGGEMSSGAPPPPGGP